MSNAVSHRPLGRSMSVSMSPDELAAGDEDLQRRRSKQLGSLGSIVCLWAESKMFYHEL